MTPAQSPLDYYRHPESLYSVPKVQALHEKEGYFRIGEEILAFGRTNTGQVVAALSRISTDALRSYDMGDICGFPFDPAELVCNLLSERYLAASGGPSASTKNLIRNAYYFVRPLLPVGIRKHLQRASLRGWQQIPFPHWPVDTTVDRVHRLVMRMALEHSHLPQIPFIWFWPQGLPACAIMTHDVEAPAGRDFCETLMDLNDSFAIKSSFQVVPEERYEVPSAWLQGIVGRGFEVNIHDLNHDGHLFDNREEFLRRAAKINLHGKQFAAAGFRSGVLYRKQAWMHALEFEYDMSVPNVAHLDPQRGGCCSVMPYFNGKLVELPVTCTQDYSLFHILRDFSINLWKTQIENITAVNGMASFIVHPDYVIDKKARDTYSQLLALLNRLRAENRIWLPLPREVARWWRDRSLMRLVPVPQGWKIEGPSSHRARLAYACLVDDKLVYRIERCSDQAAPSANETYVDD